MVSTQDLGPVTAYAIAVKYGYSGTEKEWANSLDTYRQAAAASATAAATSATDAEQSATNAKNSLSSISDSVIAANSSANSASNSSNSAATYASQAASSLATMQNTVAHLPTIGDNGNWELYDGSQYNDSGKPSQGLKGDKGDIGETGATGDAATITIGTTTTLSAGSEATVTNTGTSSNVILNLGIPQGQDGSSTITSTSVSLLSANWVGDSAPYSQDISLSGITNESTVGILPSTDSTIDDRTAWRSALISGVAGTDKITVIADGEKPTIDIPMSITIWG